MAVQDKQVKGAFEITTARIAQVLWKPKPPVREKGK